MRIVSTLLFAGFISAIAVPLDAPEMDPESANAFETLIPVTEIDPIVTGVDISDEHKANWKKKRAEYLKCLECVAAQPFPGD